MQTGACCTHVMIILRSVARSDWSNGYNSVKNLMVYEPIRAGLFVDPVNVGDVKVSHVGRVTGSVYFSR